MNGRILNIISMRTDESLRAMTESESIDLNSKRDLMGNNDGYSGINRSRGGQLATNASKFRQKLCTSANGFECLKTPILLYLLV